MLNVGERTNASGSRKFKRLLEEENWDDIMSLAREMVREGSHVIDVNVDYAGRDNAADMKQVGPAGAAGQRAAYARLDPARNHRGRLKCAGEGALSTSPTSGGRRREIPP
ncbi:MAG: dihydropteroate synthase [Phycisphaerales bacterium]